ncbi:MAG TPA: hypothetical protein VM487_21045 [Phycisphaerae bacterium]|nr:hypothetical protein [Phycisphaerae bacterium]
MDAEGERCKRTLEMWPTLTAPRAKLLQRWPDWYTPMKGRVRINERVARGCHPMGGHLGPEVSRCGDCKWLMRGDLFRRYLRCSQLVMTDNPNVRAKWRGCVEWRPT